MADQLKPCPFCGNPNPKLVSNGIGDYYVRCELNEDTEIGCDARTSDVRAEAPAVAIERWNKRAQEFSLLALAREAADGSLRIRRGADHPGRNWTVIYSNCLPAAARSKGYIARRMGLSYETRARILGWRLQPWHRRRWRFKGRDYWFERNNDLPF